MLRVTPASFQQLMVLVTQFPGEWAPLHKFAGSGHFNLCRSTQGDQARTLGRFNGTDLPVATRPPPAPHQCLRSDGHALAPDPRWPPDLPDQPGFIEMRPEVARTLCPFWLQGALVHLALAIMLINFKRTSGATQHTAAGLYVRELLKYVGRDHSVLN